MTYTIDKKKYAAPLPILCSSRIRLNDEQRKTLKDAYNALKAATNRSTPGIGGSSIQVVTEIATDLGMNDMILRDLLGSRDSLNVPVVLQLQAKLGVEVLTREDLEAAYAGYLNHIFEQANAKG